MAVPLVPGVPCGSGRGFAFCALRLCLCFVFECAFCVLCLRVRFAVCV